MPAPAQTLPFPAGGEEGLRHHAKFNLNAAGKQIDSLYLVDSEVTSGAERIRPPSSPPLGDTLLQFGISTAHLSDKLIVLIMLCITSHPERSRHSMLPMPQLIQKRTVGFLGSRQ